MKTITIPSDSTRYVVSVNGRVYVYKGGETVSVPDEVAEVIERQSEALPLPEEVKPSADDILEDATIADAGKALGIDESGNPALIEVATSSVADDILADATASDKGKALGIDASGEPALIEVGSVADELLDDATALDSGKVLGVNDSGNPALLYPILTVGGTLGSSGSVTLNKSWNAINSAFMNGRMVIITLPQYTSSIYEFSPITCVVKAVYMYKQTGTSEEYYCVEANTGTQGAVFTASSSVGYPSGKLAG